jgi:hypothetical protein
VIVVQIGSENSPQVPFAQDDEVIKALSPDRPDHPFSVGIGLSRRMHWIVTLGLECSASLIRSMRCMARPLGSLCGAGTGPSTGFITRDPVGYCVTLKWTIRRRSWTSTTNTRSTLSVAVGTTKKSIETSSWTCWSRNVRHVAEGGLRRRGWYVSTVDFATWIPSLRSSATIRGEPQVGLACPRPPNEVS